MDVIKISGKREAFNPRKIERTCIKAGASREFARQVAYEVEKNAYPGISTKEIYKLTLRFLRKQPELAEKYTLKQAIMQLGPTGFIFEKYVAAILKEYGYETRVNVSVKGRCVAHEIDIVAKREKMFMVECKYHNELGIYTDLKTVMYTYARFLDVRKFDQGWLICNTNCSYQALQYARCNNLKITSWSYPQEDSLEKMIRLKKLYPITILKGMSSHVRDHFLNNHIFMVKDLLSFPLEELQRKTKLPISLLQRFIIDAKKIV